MGTSPDLTVSTVAIEEFEGAKSKLRAARDSSLSRGVTLVKVAEIVGFAEPADGC